MEDENLTPADPYIGRRSFLSRSVAFGVGAGLIVSTGEVKAATVEPECSASAADSLLLYLDLLGRIQSQAFSDAANIISVAAKSCYSTLDALYQKVELLEAELRNSRGKAQAQQMRETIKVGKTHVETIRASFAHSRNPTSVMGTAVTLIADQVSQTAQGMLPPGKLTLTPKARKLLEDVIGLVRDFHDVPAETQKADEAHQKRVDEISSLINEIRGDLFAASSAAADADMAKSASVAQEGRARAALLIDTACTKLEKLRPKRAVARRAEPRDGAPVVDLLIKVLQGAKQSVGALNASLRGTDRDGAMKMTPAGFVANNAPSNYSRVQQALDMHCPRGTPYRTMLCAALILGPRGYSDQATRIPLIAGVLVLFPCWSGDRASLASALAQI